MPSERVQRRIDRLLDQAEEAADRHDWDQVQSLVEGVFRFDPENEDARLFLEAATRDLESAPSATGRVTQPTPEQARVDSKAQPTSFSSGRYTVSKFLGEGGKKKVYLAHDNTLDRDVAFALIKTEGLDETSRERVKREAQAMGRMGTHPCIMPIYDLGEENGQPFMVQPLMSGGDVEGLVEDAEGPLELDRALEIATQTAQGLSFAHSKGIVHRDLKPGNVWLDEDGAAKIGDFGLAVATDRSRLTVEKVMVGTVSYMPPEQATGGDVRPRADLYSLGAMLYEMCTGRVPFMGDDDIGIISQHINTPPVAPSWHNSQIPKTLDSLILRLLAKDPSERPESADEVLAVLQGIDLTAVEAREEESKGSLDSMAGGVFVGRHREMDQLKSIFENVLSGRGRMVTLVGEPGIGKTRTAQELATYAGMRGAEVLWGRSYESGGAPPYWPWVQAIRSHVAATEPQELRNQFGATAPVIAEVVSDIKAKLPDLPALTPIEDPESARFRLFDSISTFLKNTASATPLVLMLEDLHWSDKPSLMLLEFVARELVNSRILIVGNYRDMELNRRHPLSVTLGDLTRERLFERVVLRGLQKHDVQRFIEIAAGITPPSALVDTVHSQTEGNPLFVTETVRLLIQEGDITSGQSSKGGTTSWEIRIPEGVREVIGRRLDRLSERCNEVLTTAAVIGRQFRFPVLLTLLDEVSEGMLLDAMDEALSARIIEELPNEVGFYQFTHASMQETLIEEISHTRTVRMHARIAEALEEYYGSEAEDNAAELVEHFADAETVLGTEKLVKYSLAAGLQAETLLAHDLAVTHLGRGLSALTDAPMSDIKAEIMGALAQSLSGISTRHEILRVIELITDAFNHYERQGDYLKALQVADTNLSTNVGAYGMSEILERAIALGSNDSAQLGRIYAKYGRAVGLEQSRLDEAWNAFDIALDIARKSGDKALEFNTLASFANTAAFADDGERFYVAMEEAFRILPQVDEPRAEAMIHSMAAHVSLSTASGNAVQHGEASVEAARRHNIRVWLADGEYCTGMGLLRNGQVDIGLEHINLALSYSPTDPRPLGILGEFYLHTGDRERLDEVTKTLRDNSSASPINSQEPFSFAVLIVDRVIHGVSTNSEDLDAAKRILDSLIDSDSAVALRKAEAHVARSALLILENDLEGAADDFNWVQKNSDYRNSPLGHFTFGYSPYLFVSSQIKEMNDFISWIDEWLKKIKETDMVAPLPWMDYYLAEALIERNDPGDREMAIELQDEAISIATELGMKPLLERVLAKREILKA